MSFQQKLLKNIVNTYVFIDYSFSIEETNDTRYRRLIYMKTMDG